MLIKLKWLTALWTLSFAFSSSAVRPDRLCAAVSNLVALLRPGGMLLLKDYGRHDLTQLRFKNWPNGCSSTCVHPSTIYCPSRTTTPTLPTTATINNNGIVIFAVLGSDALCPAAIASASIYAANDDENEEDDDEMEQEL
ncbi:hypothetical protein niasHS_007910 [Heterodera schachtii]|uniref:Uncharacterized protein n=1 Tax=Heterodera schachtii TaxID=97005 RepID=A0ABD2JQ00_HETSC